MNEQTAALRTAVRFILENAAKFEWSLQGMGMLRLYMGNTRLHIWDHSYAAPGVSMIHDHLQWGLRSTIVAGHLVNQRYAECEQPSAVADPYEYVTLKAGYGCMIVEEPKRIWLRALPPEHYGPGDTYSQEPREVHETKAQGVCITMMQKLPTGTDLARVFWPLGEKWGSAEPRKATPEEVAAITAKALALLNTQHNAGGERGGTPSVSADSTPTVKSGVEVERDAARYRWLRANNDPMRSPTVERIPNEENGERNYHVHGEELDRVVDAAMAAAPQQEGHTPKDDGAASVGSTP